MVSYSDFETFVIILVYGVLGIIVSMLVRTLHDRGIIVDEFITGTITITDLMTGIIVLFLMFGIIHAALKD